MRALATAIPVVLLTLAACAPSGAPAAAPAKAAAAKPAAQAGAAAEPEREVRTALAAVEPWERTIRATGSLAAFEESTLSVKVAGRLALLAADLGTRVRAGEVVARLEARDYELRVAQAEAALAAARAQLGLAPGSADDTVDPAATSTVRSAQAELDDARAERDRVLELSRTGVSSRADLDRAEARLRRAEAGVQDALQTVESRRALVAQRRAELAIARQALEDTAVVAPYDGAVAERLAGTGDYLTPGAPIARLVRFDPLRVRIEVPEREAPSVRTGQAARVEAEGLQAPIAAAVTRIEPGLDERNLTLLVEIELPNADLRLRPGAFARAEIVVDPAATALCVPADALVTFAGVDKVFVVEPGAGGLVASERRVSVGRRAAGRVEALSGLEEGARVVRSPGGLQPGARVRLTE